MSGLDEPIPALSGVGWPWMLADQLRVKSLLVGYTVLLRLS
jgi:hypothetical protein